MTLLTRRDFGRAGALGAAGLVAGATTAAADGHAKAAAAIPPAMMDANLGGYKITALLDGVFNMPREFYFAEDMAAIDAAVAAAGVGPETLPIPITAYLLQSDDRNILIDAGFGDLDAFGPGFGRAMDGLAAAGVGAEDIDTIIVSHLHPDHIPGLLSGQQATFPNAELVIVEAEAKHWTDEGIMAQAPENFKSWFQLAQAVVGVYGDRVTLVQDGYEAAPGVRLEVSPGHTPGHALVHIDGGDRQLLLLGDTVSHVDLFTALPQTGFALETDTALAAQSRLKIFDKVSADGLLIAGSHIHFPGFGRIVKAGDAYRFAATTW